MGRKFILKKDIIIPKGTEFIRDRDANNRIINKLLYERYTATINIDFGGLDIIVPHTISTEYVEEEVNNENKKS